MPKNAVIYARYSDHAQKDASIEQQARECRRYAEQRDMRIIAEYYDRAMTGRSDARPEFQRMIRDAAKEHFQVVICYKVDRFARNRYDSATYKARLKKHGVQVIYAAEPIPEGPEGILLESILEGSAEYYSANLSQNVKRGMRDNALQCKVNSGNIPLGYCKGSDGRFAIEPVGAATVSEVFELYASGMPVVDIISTLNTRGLKSTRGRSFQPNSFRKMLNNERYLGIYIYDDIRIEGGMPQIVSKELWDRVQERQERSKKSPASAKAEVRFLLSGKLFCGRCGSPMVGTSGNGNGGKYAYYSCVNRLRGKTCEKKPAGKDWLEDIVVRETMEKVLQPDIIDGIADRIIELQLKEQDKSILESLKQQLKDVEKQIDGFMVAIGQGIITPTTKERLFALEEEKINLKLAIEDESQEQPFVPKEQIVAWMDQFRADGAISERQKETIIDAFISAVYLYDDKLRVVYSYDSDSNSMTLEILNETLNEVEVGSDLASHRPPDVALVPELSGTSFFASHSQHTALGFKYNPLPVT